MTTDELKAAADRLRRWDAGEATDSVYPRSVYPAALANDDAWDLSREFMARLADDERQSQEDAKPITEEWLRSLGWKQWDDRDDVYSGEWYRTIGEWLEWETRITYHLGCVEAVRMCAPDECDGLSAESVALLGAPCSKSNRVTCGQLRKLIEALKGGDA